MSRQRGRQLQGFGCVLIVTVMLIDHFCSPYRTILYLPAPLSPPSR